MFLTVERPAPSSGLFYYDSGDKRSERVASTWNWQLLLANGMQGAIASEKFVNEDLLNSPSKVLKNCCTQKPFDAPAR